MEKRLILAIALSLLILLSWSTWVSKTYHIDNKEVTEQETPQQPFIPSAITTSPLSVEIPPSSLFRLEQEKYDVIFIEPQAAVKEVVFKEYPSAGLSLNQGFLFAKEKFIFERDALSPQNEARFVYSDEEKQIIKRFIFSNSNYTTEMEINVQNLSPVPLNFNLPLILGVLDFGRNQYEARYQDVTIMSKERPWHLNARKDTTVENLQFTGLRNRYFCAIIEPASQDYSLLINRLNSQESIVGIQSKPFVLAPGQQISEKFRIYLGPQELKIINRINPQWSAIMYYGTFNLISHLLLRALDFLYLAVHNWGWAIVFLSLGIYFLLYPLSLKQMRSMKEMQVLQPQIEELRRLYKNNPQKLNKEIMELYRQHKVNPFSGCLPLLLQIPIFYALYQALMRFVALKGARFLWIKDLSEPDRLFVLPESFPINEINILPIAMAIGMFVQQRISLTSAGGSSAKQQKLMSILFPLMFGFIFYPMPSALVLYWFINSTLMLGQQFWMKRKR